MFRIHGTIFAAAGRGESPVVTCYDYPTAGKKKGFTYVSSFNVRVGMNLWVRGRSQDAPQAKPKPAGLTQRVKRLAGGRKRRKLVPAAAAAIILIAVGLILVPLTANGRIALGEVYQAIGNVQNVFMSRFVPGKEEPTRGECVSRTLDLWLQKTEKQAVLFALRTRMRTVRDLSTGSIETDAMTEELVLKVESVVAGYFDLVPFPDIADVPGDAQWIHVPGDQVQTIIPGTDVYDLTWLEDTQWLHKWRFFVGRATHLPHKIEGYQKLAGEAEYTFKWTKMVRYPGEPEIEGVIREAFE
jgi:hypothetical protein